MLKNIVRLEHKIGDRLYHFLCDQDAPLHEAKEALVQFLTYGTNMQNTVPPPVVPVPPVPEPTAPPEAS